MLTVFSFIVIIMLLFVCQRIQFYIQEPSILKSNTTLLDIMFKKGILDIQFIDTEHQWDDIFIKPLTMEIFDFIKKNLNMHFVFD